MANGNLQLPRSLKHFENAAPSGCLFRVKHGREGQLRSNQRESVSVDLAHEMLAIAGGELGPHFRLVVSVWHYANRSQVLIALGLAETEGRFEENQRDSNHFGPLACFGRPCAPNSADRKPGA